jgi:PAS domain S-box-containing protein
MLDLATVARHRAALRLTLDRVEDVSDADHEVALQALVAERFDAFGTGGLAPTLVWALALGYAAPHARGMALATVVLQAAFFALSRLVVRRSAFRATDVAFAFASGLGLSMVALFLAAGAVGELLGFTLFTLCTIAAVLFPWGWRRELTLVAMALTPLAASSLRLPFFLGPLELMPVVIIAAMLCIAIAEGNARAFRTALARRRSEEAARRDLAASHDNYRDMTEHARDSIWAVDLEGRITYINEAGARFLGKTPAELIGKNVDDQITDHPLNPDPDAMRAVLERDAALPPTVIQLRNDAGQHWLEMVGYAVRNAAGAIVGFRGISRDVTARFEAEAALQQSLAALREREEQLRLLGRQQVAIREAERKRLSFDLHDGVCQELVGIGILIESARRRGVSAAADPTLGQAQMHLREVGEHLRLMARDLRPLQLPDLGLREALGAMARGMETDGVRVAVEFPTPIPRLGEETEVAVYRVAQEALANAVRHAGARAVTLTLTARAGLLRLQVHDDGRGFVRNELDTPALGLVAMEERAAALGGRLRVCSTPGTGTTIVLECPLTIA